MVNNWHDNSFLKISFFFVGIMLIGLTPFFVKDQLQLVIYETFGILLIVASIKLKCYE